MMPSKTRAHLFTPRLATLAVTIAVAVALSATRGARAESIVATIPVGSSPQQVQLTPDQTKLYVSNELANTVSVISTASNTVTNTIPVGTDPGPIRFTPNGAKAYVANLLSNTVSVINVATNSVSATVPVGVNPVTLSRTDDGTKVFVANEGSNTVSVISTATDTVIGAPTAVGVSPNTMAKTPDGAKLYVANQGSNSISVISTSSNSVLITISLAPSQDPGSIHFLPNGTKGYVANRGCVSCVPQVAPTVSVINVATNAVIKTVTVGAIGAAPHSMRITPDGKKLYLVNKHGDDVVVMDTITDTVLTTIALDQGSCTNASFGIGSCPVRVELSPTGGKAYVVEEKPLAANGVLTTICNGTVPYVCTNTDNVIARVTVGNTPTDMEVSTAGRAYVSNSGSNTVSVVSLTSAGVGGIAELPDVAPVAAAGGASSFRTALLAGLALGAAGLAVRRRLLSRPTAPRQGR